MSEYATQNEREAKQKQRHYYHKKSRDRKLEVGQKALVVLPTNTTKLLASWKGPFIVTDKVSPVDCRVKLKGERRKFFT